MCQFERSLFELMVPFTDHRSKAHVSCMLMCCCPHQLQVIKARQSEILRVLNVPHRNCEVLRECAVLICNEFRSASVNAEFKRVFEGHFVMRSVGRKHMDEAYQHADIHLLSLSRRKRPLPNAVRVDSVMHTGVPGPAAAPR